MRRCENMLRKRQRGKHHCVCVTFMLNSDISAALFGTVAKEVHNVKVESCLVEIVLLNVK